MRNTTIQVSRSGREITTAWHVSAGKEKQRRDGDVSGWQVMMGRRGVGIRRTGQALNGSSLPKADRWLNCNRMQTKQLAARIIHEPLEEPGCRGTDTTETKHKRRHLAGSGEIPRLRSAVAVVETAVALVGPGLPGCKCRVQVQNAKLQLRGSPLQRFSTHPSRQPARRCLSSLRCTCVASAGGSSSSLLIVHQGGLDRILEAGEDGLEVQPT